MEGDLDWADITKSGANAIGPYKTDIDTLATARARAGFAVDRALLYRDRRLCRRGEEPSYAGIGSQSDWRSAGVIGGGLEYAFTNNISAKAEYLYAPFGGKYFGGTPAAEKSGLDLSLIRAGLNYKF